MLIVVRLHICLPHRTGTIQMTSCPDTLNVSALQTDLEYLSRWKTVLASMALPVIVTVE